MDEVPKFYPANAAVYVPPTYLSATQVRQRYGNVSQMTIWRWLNNPELGFPRPHYIARRRYFLLTELEAFDARQSVLAELRHQDQRQPAA
ncbi:MAG: transcriptional regulator [Phenylobacterium sp.]|nr:transcriptional regulator [Phenylobacterium sp.]